MARLPADPVTGSELEILTPLQIRMGWPLGQLGVNCYPHTPRLVAEVVEAALRPVVLLGECEVNEGDAPPATVASLVRRVAGQARYSAALHPDGPKAAAGFDRWKLTEWITVRWDHGDGRRGFALWKRSGRGRWTPAAAWWRGVDRRWTPGRPADVPSRS